MDKKKSAPREREQISVNLKQTLVDKPELGPAFLAAPKGYFSVGSGRYKKVFQIKICTYKEEKKYDDGSIATIFAKIDEIVKK